MTSKDDIKKELKPLSKELNVDPKDIELLEFLIASVPENKQMFVAQLVLDGMKHQKMEKNKMMIYGLYVVVLIAVAAGFFFLGKNISKKQ